MVDSGGAISLGGGLILNPTNNGIIADMPAVASNVVRRSATATAGLGEATVFTGSTAGQTITLPALGLYTNAIYRIVNDASVAVQILGGTNSLSINGTIYGAASPFTVPAGTSYDFVYDSTGIWQCFAISQTAGSAISQDSGWNGGLTFGTAFGNMVATNSLAVGTWLINATYMFHLGTSSPAGASATGRIASTGTATATFSPNNGYMTALVTAPLAPTTGQWIIAASLTAIAVVTVAGTVYFQAEGASLGTGPTVDIEYTAIKIA